MRVYYQVNDFRSSCQPAVSVGIFDGVHLGHAEIIHSLTSYAKKTHCESAIVTFHPHPRLVLNAQGQIMLLQTIEEKLLRFEQLGVDVVLVTPFTREFAQMSPTDFIKDILVEKMHVGHIVTGYDHFFGQHRQGNIELLNEMGFRFGFSVEELNPINNNSKPISSSAIRKALIDGDIMDATEMLGYNYSISGLVASGNKIGRNIGYPTANLKPADIHKLIPAQGVYATLVKINGLTYKGMTNIGYRPTVDSENMTIEMNIFDFDQDIYDQNITIIFIDRIRNEKKFSSLGNLQMQLANDKIVAREMLQSFE